MNEEFNNANNQNEPNFTIIDSVAQETPVKQKKSNKRLRKFLKKSVAIVSAAALFGAVAGAGFQGVLYLNNKKNTTVSDSNTSTASQEAIAGTNTDLAASSGSVVSTSTSGVTATDVSGVVENVLPAIVAINCTSTMTQYDFFGRQYDSEVSGSGSGIIIGQNDNELLIATNNHVVDGATVVEIVFADETKAAATIKGTEASSDLAVVSVNLNDLSEDTKNNIRIATLGDSTTLKPGELAIAIGNALGYGQSVTVGYISALDREVTVDDVTLSLIQTDAAINPGNSGGALINANGEIIGINSVKYSDTSVEGIGYAIPITTAIPIINELMNRVELSEGEMAYLGIRGWGVEQSYANTFNMPLGVYVDSVADNTAASQAGLKRGDIITGLNGKTITTMTELLNTLNYTRGGSQATITYKSLVNGEYVEQTVTVTLGYRTQE